MDRPAIPAELKRTLMMEAGYRCSIPRCKQTPVEIHHISPWEKVREHNYDNLIVLCCNCHARANRGEIDSKALHQYKANLAIVNGRYCQMEQRIFRYFYQNHDSEEIPLGYGFDLLLLNAIEDGLLEKSDDSFFQIAAIPVNVTYRITAKGRDFIDRWFENREID